MMKKLLGHKKAKGIGLRDLFPQEKMAEVNQLNKIGNYLRMEKVITKYKVINIGNAPVIQVIYEDGRFYTTMEQDRIDDILKIMPEDEEMDQDSQQQGGRQDDQQNNDKEQQQRPLVLYSGGGAKAKRPTGGKDETEDIRGEEIGGRGGSSGTRNEDGAVGGAVGGAGGSGGGRGGRSSGKSSRNASSSRGRSGSGASAGKIPAKSNSDSDKVSYAQKAGTRGGLANRTKKPADSNTMLKFITSRLPGASGKN